MLHLCSGGILFGDGDHSFIPASPRVGQLNQTCRLFQDMTKRLQRMPIFKICNTDFIPLVQMNGKKVYFGEILTKYTLRDEVAQSNIRATNRNGKAVSQGSLRNGDH